MIEQLKSVTPYVYLATPYSKYQYGLEAAFREASAAAAVLVRNGVKVYSPIAHTHPVAIYGNIDPLDHHIWLPADLPFMELAGALAVLQMPGWEESYGIKEEIQVFEELDKPIFYLPWPLQ